MKRYGVSVLCGLMLPFSMVWAQFMDDFGEEQLHAGWETYSGDGYVTSEMAKAGEHAVFKVDATRDTLNIWWAIIKRQVDGLDMDKLVLPEYELRVEAKIKISHTPRRVNLHVNHSRTTDFHSHLKEYYIGDTSSWHVLSMTTIGFDAKPSDKVNVQMAMMDWGRETCAVWVDYVKVDVVKASETGPDMGNPLEYHPEVGPLEDFRNQLEMEGATLDAAYPGRNFAHWNDGLNPVSGNLLSVGQSRFLIFKADFSAHKGKNVKGWGALSVYLHHFERSPDFKKDFGHLRLVEILGGDADWDGKQVSYRSFVKGQDLDEVMNGQMIIDVDPTLHEKGLLKFAIPEPVLQRLIEGRTKGLALFPLGAIQASFFSDNSPEIERRPAMYFDLSN